MYQIPQYQLRLVRDPSVDDTTIAERVKTSEDFHRLMAGHFSGLDREHMKIVAINAKNEIIGMHTVAIGTLTRSLVHPREVWKAALLMNPAGIILAHNHPSGDPTPSKEDLALTARMVACGQLLGVQIMDHIVFVERGYWSMADHGQLPELPSGGDQAILQYEALEELHLLVERHFARFEEKLDQDQPIAGREAKEAITWFWRQYGPIREELKAWEPENAPA
ncbi:MAG: JAB domain-containing protein [Nitrospirota bacterium]